MEVSADDGVQPRRRDDLEQRQGEPHYEGRCWIDSLGAFQHHGISEGKRAHGGVIGQEEKYVGVLSCIRRKCYWVWVQNCRFSLLIKSYLFLFFIYIDYLKVITSRVRRYLNIMIEARRTPQTGNFPPPWRGACLLPHLKHCIRWSSRRSCTSATPSKHCWKVLCIRSIIGP